MTNLEKLIEIVGSRKRAAETLGISKRTMEKYLYLQPDDLPMAMAKLIELTLKEERQKKIAELQRESIAAGNGDG